MHDRSKAVRAYLTEHPSMETVPFPGDTPEATPDEEECGYTKHGRLANFAPEHTDELRCALVAELERLHRCPEVLAAFIRNACIPIRLRL